MQKTNETLIFWLVVAVICVTAWAFWHYLGPAADTVLLVIVVAGLILENRRLRRKQR